MEALRRCVLMPGTVLARAGEALVNMKRLTGWSMTDLEREPRVLPREAACVGLLLEPKVGPG